MLQNPYMTGLSTSKSKVHIVLKIFEHRHCFGNRGTIIFIITNGDNNSEMIAHQNCSDPLEWVLLESDTYIICIKSIHLLVHIYKSIV